MRSVIVLAVVVLTAACGEAADRPAAPTVQDSAGVRVVIHPDAAGPAFTVGATPLVRAGTDETGGPTVFGVVGGQLLADGGMLVMDGGNYRMLRWSEAGALVDSLGRRGGGPGEFENVSWVHPTADGTAVYDARSRRISWFDAERGFLRSMPFSLERPDPPTDDAIVASGAAIGVVGPSEAVGYAMAWADPVGEVGPMPLYGDLAVYDSTLTSRTALGRFMLLEWYEDPAQERFPVVNRMETPRIQWSGRDDVLAVSHATEPRVDVIRGGRRTTVIRETRPRLPFEPDSIPPQFAVAADSLQAYRDVQVDGAHRIWIKPAVVEGTDSTTWRVFDIDGARLGDVTLPTDATVLDADGDRLLLLRRSDLDVEFLEIRALRAPR